MWSGLAILGSAAVFAASALAEHAGWQLQPQSGADGPILTFNAGDPLSYRFECTADAVLVTETGVTKLIDLKTGQPIGDGAQAVMPAGAAMMALYGGKGNPQFVEADAVKNPADGWDLTIRLSKDDKQIRAVGKGQTMSLFTTGFTMAVAMDGASRNTWNEFVDLCQAKVR